MDTLERYFASRVNAFMRSTGMSPTTLGLKAVGDPNLVRQIERGRSPSLRTADRVLSFMRRFGRDPGRTRDRSRRRRARDRARPAARRSTPAERPGGRRTDPPTRFLRLPEVMARTGLSRATIYARMAEGRFPRQVRIGARAVGWIEAEVEAWIQERIARSRGAGGGTEEG